MFEKYIKCHEMAKQVIDFGISREFPKAHRLMDELFAHMDENFDQGITAFGADFNPRKELIEATKLGGDVWTTELAKLVAATPPAFSESTFPVAILALVMSYPASNRYRCTIWKAEIDDGWYGYKDPRNTRRFKAYMSLSDEETPNYSKLFIPKYGIPILRY